MGLMIARSGVFALCLFALAACGEGEPWAALEPGEEGRVVRVSDGDSIVLDTGQSVRLVGLEAPSFGRGDRPDAPHAEASRRALEDMVLGRRVQLRYAGLTRDRYDRALAHIITIDRLGPEYWVNHEIAARGLARVRIYPDTALESDALFAAEEQAMAAGAGLWGERAYAIRDARDLGADEMGFHVIEGVLGPRGPARFDDNACSRDLLGSGVEITVDLTAMAACDLEPGLRVQVRGWYREGRLRLNASQNVRPRRDGAVFVARE